MIDRQINEIDLNGRQISYHWRVSARAKRFRVVVGPQGVEVITPSGTSGAQMEKFLRLHGDWVLEQLLRMEKLERRRRPPQAAMANLPPGTILLQGKQIRFTLREDHGLKSRCRIEESAGSIRVNLPPGKLKSAEEALELHLKRKASIIIPARVAELAPRSGKVPQSISIRSQKSRWGSCSSRGTLSFNWRLVMAPLEVLDYVILHELVHLSEPNHSSRFWQKVAELDPEFKQHRGWLKENQSYLYDPLVR